MEPAIVERRISCPYCAECIDIVLDLTAGSQCYIEDCQVCCQPIQIGFEVNDARLEALQVDRV